MLATQGILTYYANRRSTVLMYADAFGLLVLTASLTSASLPKTSFGQTEKSLLSRLFSYLISMPTIRASEVI
jgi:hypothetical protein